MTLVNWNIELSIEARGQEGRRDWFLFLSIEENYIYAEWREYTLQYAAQ